MNGITFHKEDYLGVSYGDKHTWEDWGLILKVKPDIAFPETKTKYIDITGGNGQIDLTSLLTYDTKYDNRVGSFVFSSIRPRDHWNTLKSEIANFLHGQRVKMILDEDPDYYWMGRFTLNEWLSDKKIGELTIDYNLEPYKYEMFTSVEDYEWDTFNFETGVVRQWKDIRIDGPTDIVLIGSRMPVIPTLTIETDDGNGFHGVGGLYGFPPVVRGFNLPDGTYKDPNFVIRENTYLHPYHFYGETSQHGVTYQNTGTITIEYRGGSL